MKEIRVGSFILHLDTPKVEEAERETLDLTIDDKIHHKNELNVRDFTLGVEESRTTFKLLWLSYPTMAIGIPTALLL